MFTSAALHSGGTLYIAPLPSTPASQTPTDCDPQSETTMASHITGTGSNMVPAGAMRGGSVAPPIGGLHPSTPYSHFPFKPPESLASYTALSAASNFVPLSTPRVASSPVVRAPSRDAAEYSARDISIPLDLSTPRPDTKCSEEDAPLDLSVKSSRKRDIDDDVIVVGEQRMPKLYKVVGPPPPLLSQRHFPQPQQQLAYPHHQHPAYRHVQSQGGRNVSVNNMNGSVKVGDTQNHGLSHASHGLVQMPQFCGLPPGVVPNRGVHRLQQSSAAPGVQASSTNAPGGDIHKPIYISDGPDPTMDVRVSHRNPQSQQSMSPWRWTSANVTSGTSVTSAGSMTPHYSPYMIGRSTGIPGGPDDHNVAHSAMNVSPTSGIPGYRLPVTSLNSNPQSCLAPQARDYQNVTSRGIVHPGSGHRTAPTHPGVNYIHPENSSSRLVMSSPVTTGTAYAPSVQGANMRCVTSNSQTIRGTHVNHGWESVPKTPTSSAAIGQRHISALHGMGQLPSQPPTPGQCAQTPQSQYGMVHHGSPHGPVANQLVRPQPSPGPRLPPPYSSLPKVASPARASPIGVRQPASPAASAAYRLNPVSQGLPQPMERMPTPTYRPSPGIHHVPSWDRRFPSSVGASYTATYAQAVKVSPFQTHQTSDASHSNMRQSSPAHYVNSSHIVPNGGQTPDGRLPQNLHSNTRVEEPVIQTPIPGGSGIPVPRSLCPPSAAPYQACTVQSSTFSGGHLSAANDTAHVAPIKADNNSPCSSIDESNNTPAAKKAIPIANVNPIIVQPKSPSVLHPKKQRLYQSRINTGSCPGSGASTPSSGCMKYSDNDTSGSNFSALVSEAMGNTFKRLLTEDTSPTDNCIKSEKEEQSSGQRGMSNGHILDFSKLNRGLCDSRKKSNSIIGHQHSSNIMQNTGERSTELKIPKLPLKERYKPKDHFGRTSPFRHGDHLKGPVVQDGQRQKCISIHKKQQQQEMRKYYPIKAKAGNDMNKKGVIRRIKKDGEGCDYPVNAGKDPLVVCDPPEDRGLCGAQPRPRGVGGRRGRGRREMGASEGRSRGRRPRSPRPEGTATGNVSRRGRRPGPKDALNRNRKRTRGAVQSAPDAKRRRKDQHVVLATRTRTQTAAKQGVRRLSSSYNKNAAYERELKRDEYRKLIKRIQRQSQQYIGNRERRIVTRERLGVIFSDTGSEDEREEEKGAEGDIERRMVKQPRSQPKDVVRRKRPYRRRQPLDGGLVSQTSPLQKVKRKYTRREVGTKTVNRLTDGETRRVNDNEEEGVVLAKKRRYRRRLPSAGHRNVDDDQLRMRKRRHQFRIEGRCRLAGSRGRGGLFRRRGVWIDRRTDPGACYKQSRDVEYARNTCHETSGLDEDCAGADVVPVPEAVRRLIVYKETGETLLHKAARLGNEEVIEYCLQTGFDVNGRDNAGYTPLHETCVRGHVNAARLLVTHGADPNANAHDGTRPMHDAVDNNNTEIVRLLLAFGADIKLVTFGGRNIMKLAKTDLVKDLLKGYLADLNGPEEQEQEVPWAFASSCVLDSSGDCGCDVFDNIPPESEEPEPAEGDVEFDFSDKALLPAYNLAILPINGCHNYHRLDDVIEVLGVSRTNFEDSYPDVDILEVSRALFDRQARTRQSKDTGKSGDPNSSNPTEFGSDHVFVIENSDRIREILGVTIEWVHAVRPMVVAPSCQPHHPAAPPTGVIRSHLPPSPAPDLPQAKYADIVSLSSSNIEATSKNTSMGDNEFNTQVSILEHIKSADFNKNKAVSDGDMTKQTTNCGVLPVASVLLASPDSHCPEVLSDVKKVSCTESEGVVGGISILPDVLTTNTREIVPEVSPSVRLPEVTSEKEMPVQTESEEAMVRDAERRSDTQPLPSEAGTTPCDSEYVVRTMVCKQTEVEPIVPCVASGDIKAEPECESLSGPRSEECDTTQGVSQGGSDDGQSVKPEEVESNKDASQSECPSAIQTTTQSTGSNPCPKNVDKEVPENLNQPADEKAAPTDASKCAEEYQHISGGNEQTVNSQENIGPLCSGAERDAQTSTKSDRDSYTGKPTGSGADVTTDMVAVVAPPSGQEHGPNVNTQKTQSDGQREANTCNSVSFAGTDPNKTSVLDSQENPDAQKPDRVLNDPNTVKIDTVKPAETFTETPTTGPTGAHARSAESECENDVLCKCPTSGQPDSNNTDDVVEKTQISSQHQTTSSTVSSNCSVNEIKIASTPEDCGLEACAPGRKRCVSGDRSVSPKAAETMPKAASDIPAACAGAAAPPSSIVSSISSDKEHNNNNNSSLAEDTFDTGLPVLEKHETEGVDDVSNDVHVATPLNDDTNEDREMPQLTIQAY